MHVVHIVPMISQRFGGPATFVAQLAPHLDALDVRSTIVATNLGQVPSSGQWRALTEEELPANVDDLELELFDVDFPQRLARSRSMRRRLEQLIPDADLVHIHSLWLYPQYVAQRLARKNSVPFIVSPHGALDPFLRRHGRPRKFLSMLLWQSKMLDTAQALHVTTEEEKGFVHDVASGVPRAVIPIGINVAEFEQLGDEEHFRQKFLAGDRSRLILFLGRLTFKKGVDVLIESFAEVAAERSDVKLVICGPDDEGLAPGLNELVARLNLADRVVFTGPVYGDDRAAALSAASVWALTSHTENFGIAVLEALAAGLPVVVSEGVNLASSVREVDAGEVVELQPHLAAAAIMRLLDDEDRRREVSDRARRFAAGYDWSQIADRYAEFYVDAVGRNQTTGAVGDNP